MASNSETRSVEIIIKGTQASSSIKEISAAAAVLRNQLNKLPTDSKEFIAKSAELRTVNKRLKDIRDDVNNVSSSFKGMTASFLSANLLERSLDALMDFGRESITAFLEAEKNAKKLEFAINNIAGEGQSALKRLLDQSAQLQEQGIFSDDDIQVAQTALIQYGLTSRQVEKLIPQILDLAAAQGIDLAAATDKVISAINGQTKGLKEAGIQFEDTGSKTENLAVLTEKLTKFQGANSDQLNSTEGTMTRYANRWDDIKESAGEALVEIARGIGLISDLFTKGLDAVNLDLRLSVLRKHLVKYNEDILEIAQKSEAARTLQVSISTQRIIRYAQEVQNAKNKAEFEQANERLKNEQRLNEQLRKIGKERTEILEDKTKAGNSKDEAAIRERERSLQDLRNLSQQYADAELNDMAATEREKLELQVMFSTRALEQKIAAAKKAGATEQQIAEAQGSALMSIYQRYADNLSALEAKEALKAKEAKDKANKDEWDQAVAYVDKLADMQAATNQEELDRIEHQNDLKKQAARDFGGQMLDYFEATNTIQRNAEQEALNAEEEKLSASQKQNKELFDQKIIDQKEFNKREAKAQKQYDDKAKEIKKQQFEREQEIARFRTIISGAQGVAEIWGTYAELPYLAAALTAAQVAIIGAQLAAIDSAPKPYAKGGFNDSDNPQGFTSGPTLFSNSASGRPFIAGEAGREWIAPNWMLENPQTANVINQLENIRQTRTFATGGSTATAQPMFTSASSTAPSSSPDFSRLAAAIDNLVNNGVEARLYFDQYTKDLDKINGAKYAARIG